MTTITVQRVQVGVLTVLGALTATMLADNTERRAPASLKPRGRLHDEDDRDAHYLLSS